MHGDRHFHHYGIPCQLIRTPRCASSCCGGMLTFNLYYYSDACVLSQITFIIPYRNSEGRHCEGNCSYRAIKSCTSTCTRLSWCTKVLHLLHLRGRPCPTGKRQKVEILFAWQITLECCYLEATQSKGMIERPDTVAHCTI